MQRVHVNQCPSLDRLSLHCVEIENVSVAPACQALQGFQAEVVDEVRRTADQPKIEAERQEVRQLLRFGKFKASGRSKPAQEYLLRCALQDAALPQINGPVDLLNAISLQYNLPISLLSVAKCSNRLYVRRGLPGESFVFNSGGQMLELQDLITTYAIESMAPANLSTDRVEPSNDSLRPVGTPVKDSMAGKIEANDTHLIAIIYAPASATAMERGSIAASELAEKMERWCGAKTFQ